MTATVRGMGLRPEDLERGEVYRREWLLERGMHRRHLSSPAMTRVLPTCYTRTDYPADLRRVAVEAQDLLGCPSVVAGVTAAELFGVRLPRRARREGGARVHLDTSGGSSPRRTETLVVHRCAPPPTIRLHGVTMVEPLTALQEIAGRLTLDELVIAIDSLVADRFGTAWRIPLTEVREQAGAARGRGAKQLREAAALARERVWSPRETQMHLLLRRYGRPVTVMNHEVVDPATGIVYYIDLAYPERRIAIEYDGAEHLTAPDRVRQDHRKSAVLAAEGWTVIRVYSEDIHEPTDFFARLEYAWGTETTTSPPDSYGPVSTSAAPAAAGSIGSAA